MSVSGTDTRQHVKLPACLMRAIERVTTDSDASQGDILGAVLLITFGYAFFDRQDTVDGRDILLPRDQWLAICGQLTAVQGSAINRVNLGLSWMNSGPSAED